MSVTEILFTPLLKADPGRPLITHYDDAAGTRIELSRATVKNWAAKTANWLRDEHDVEPGDPVAVLLPAHWQTVGLLLGAWWCGARVVGAGEDAKVAVVPPGGTADADVVAVASLHPMGLGSGAPVDYADDVRVHGDDFMPWSPFRDRRSPSVRPLWMRSSPPRGSSARSWAPSRACCPLWSGTRLPPCCRALWPCSRPAAHSFR